MKLILHEAPKSSSNELTEEDDKWIGSRKRDLKYGICMFLMYSFIGFFLVLFIRNLSDEWRKWQKRNNLVISCYYNTPSLPEGHQLLPADIDPQICTHINIAFAQIKNKTIYFDDHQYKSLAAIVSLKKVNPKLKILLSIGGASNDSGFPEMVADHASRKVFIRSMKAVLRNHSLDGIDLDWEFPAVSYDGFNVSVLRKRERQHFSQLLREIRMEYIREKENYLLTVALAAPQIIVDAAYDVDQINMYVDYANIMTYDFHFFSEFTPFTGLNSPLFPRAVEHLYMATLNINYTVHMYIDKGLDRDKIVIGIPTYGHSFNLVNWNNSEIGSPASGYGNLGHKGFVSYPDLCHFMKIYKNDTKFKVDTDSMVPYLYRGHEWVSYENQRSVMEKAKYVTQNDLRGAMIYSLNADDYAGKCQGFQKFPLAIAIKKALNGIICFTVYKKNNETVTEITFASTGYY